MLRRTIEAPAWRSFAGGMGAMGSAQEEEHEEKNERSDQKMCKKVKAPDFIPFCDATAFFHHIFASAKPRALAFGFFAPDFKCGAVAKRSTKVVIGPVAVERGN